MKMIFERQTIYEEQAKLTGEALQPHEGFNRTNGGDWIITDETGRQACIVPFRGTAKRGQLWNAPDPEGQALARLIVEKFNG
jgi:hypothetical protein